jgi:hypothetical protein
LLYDLSGSQSGPLWALNMCHCLLCRSHSLVNPPDQVISVISGQVSICPNSFSNKATKHQN